MNQQLTDPTTDVELGPLDALFAKHIARLSNVLRPIDRVHQRRTVVVNATVAANGFALLGTVPPGRMWNLAGIVVMSADPWTAFASPVALCAGKFDPNSGVNLPDVIQTGLTAPAAFWFPGEDSPMARGNEDVYVVVKAGVLGQVAINLIYDDYTDNSQNPPVL